MNWRKILPVAVVLIALAGLYINYLGYQNSKKDCGCGGHGGASKIN